MPHRRGHRASPARTTRTTRRGVQRVTDSVASRGDQKPIINRTATGTHVSFNGPGGGHSSRTRSSQTPRAPRVNNNRNGGNSRSMHFHPYSTPVQEHWSRYPDGYSDGTSGYRHSSTTHTHNGNGGGQNPGGSTREAGPCEGLEANQSNMWMGMQYTLCPDGSCIQGFQYQCPNSRMRAPGGTGGSSY